MGFSLRTLTGGFADRASSGALRWVENPLLVAALLTALALAVVYAFFGAPPAWGAGCRCAAVVLALVGVVLGVHYYALDRRLQQKHGSDASSRLVNQVHTAQHLGGSGPSVIPVIPTPPAAAAAAELPLEPPEAPTPAAAPFDLEPVQVTFA